MLGLLTFATSKPTRAASLPSPVMVDVEVVRRESVPVIAMRSQCVAGCAFDVRALGNGLKVHRVHTATVDARSIPTARGVPVVADVVDLEFLGDRPVGEFVGNPVGEDGDPRIGVPNTPVPGIEASSRPQPAPPKAGISRHRPVFVDVRPEPLLKRGTTSVNTYRGVKRNPASLAGVMGITKPLRPCWSLADVDGTDIHEEEYIRWLPIS